MRPGPSSLPVIGIRAAICLLLGLLSPAALPAQDADRASTPVDRTLLRAAEAGRPRLLEQALAAGANPDAATGDGISSLVLATRAGESEAVRVLLDAGAECPGPETLRANDGEAEDPRFAPLDEAAREEAARGGDERDPEGALAVAADMGRHDLVLLLLGRCGSAEGTGGTDPAEEGGRWTALQWAAFRGHVEIVESLVKAGARLDAGRERGATPLALALRGGYVEAAQILVNAGADVDARIDPLVFDGSALSFVKGGTALHVATKAELVTLAVSLFEAGADVEVIDQAGKTPIHLAFDEGEDELLQAYYCAASSTFRGRNGDGLARSALAWGDTAIAEFIRSPACGADRIAGLLRTAKLREALTDAARQGDAAEVARLLAAGAPAESRDRHGATAMLLAASAGSRETVELLAARGADCSELGRIYDGELRGGWARLLTLGGQWIGAPLARASMRGHLDVARYLVEDCGVPVDEREWEPAEGQQTGWTSLQRAAFEGHAEIVGYLLERGADVEGGRIRTDTVGVTCVGSCVWTPPLMLAARRGFLDIVRMLLQAGARVDYPFELESSLLYLSAVAEETLLRLAYCAGPVAYRTEHAAELRDVARAEGHAHFLHFLDDPSCDDGTLDDLVRAHTRRRIAGDRYREGRFAEMEEHARFALDVRRRILGDDHPDVADALNLVAVARLYQGDYASALGLHERALEIRRGAFGEEDPRVAISLNNLGFAYAAMGDYGRALPLYEASLEIRERISEETAEDFDLIGTALSNLADVHLALGEFETALALQERALAARRRAASQGSANNGLVNESLLDLADNRSLLGDHDEARRLSDQALERLRPLGDHVDVAKATSTVAGIRLRAGELGEALSLYERALAIRRRVYGDAHPSVAEDAAGAARVALELGLDDLAAQVTLDGASTLSKVLLETLPTLSVAEQTALLDRDVPLYTGLISRLAERPELREGYGYMLAWKGSLLRGMRFQRQVAGLRSDPRFDRQARALEEVREALGAWFHQAGRVPLAEWRARNDSLSLVKERLERSLASTTGKSALVAGAADLGLGSLQRWLADDEVLVDAYRLRDPLGDPGDSGRVRYAAVITGRTAGPVYVELGPAGPVDEDIASWLDRVDRLRADREIWSVLEEELWQPIRAALPPGIDRIWVSPDAALARLPWHLFTGSHQVSIIGSATELVELRQSDRPSMTGEGGTVLALGNVDFDAAPQADAERDPQDYLPPLPGTADEVARVVELGRNAGYPVRTLTGAAATKGAFTSALTEARYAHLATHGFFFEDTRDGSARIAAGADRILEPDAGPAVDRGVVGGGRNPLVETGLALAGASRRDPTSLRPLGRLTAEELVSLDLSSLRLVTLSACDTGRGREVTGQGVIGLQSAIFAAGARSVLMSLWKVDDESTALLMGAFYRGLWDERLAPEEALRSAQAAVRSHPSGAFSAPAFWAAWTIAGEAW